MNLRKRGKNYNSELKNKKDFSNLDYINKQIQNYELDEYGSNYSADKFDLKGKLCDYSDFYDAIARKQSEIPGTSFANQGPKQTEKVSRFSSMKL